MTWVSHMTMRRARLDSENAEFFADLEPATVRDFYPVIGIVTGLSIAGIYFVTSGDNSWFALLAVTAALLIVVRQMYAASRFWQLSISE